MILYHGSYMEIAHPDLAHSRDKLDFGKGFYTTPLYDQAKRFKREKIAEKTGVVSKYELNAEVYKKAKVLKFEAYNKEWLDFILTCRTGQDQTDYDIVIGGIANDRVFNTVELYFSGLIDEEIAIKRLKYTKPNLQICFRTPYALSFLKFQGSERL